MDILCGSWAGSLQVHAIHNTDMSKGTTGNCLISVEARDSPSLLLHDGHYMTTDWHIGMRRPSKSST